MEIKDSILTKIDITDLKNGKLVIPEGVTEIAENIFPNDAMRDLVTEIVFPKSLVFIDDSSFAFCINLKNIELSNGIKIIGERAFENCSSLTKINLPDSIEDMGKSAFSDCEALKSVKLPNQLEKLPANIFSGCENLTQINLPSTLKTIGKNAFYLCFNLSKINLPENLENIEDKAFFNCTRLSEITFPNSLKIIGNSSFEGCILLKSLIIPDNVTKLGAGAFKDCTGLEDVYISKGIKDFEPRVFFNCVELKNLYLNENLESVGYFTFENCYGLKDVHLPESVKRIEEGAFYNCKNLKTINLPNNIYEINRHAFCRCSKLSSIILPENLETISAGTFENCQSLSNVIFPKNLKTIGETSFSNTNISKLDLPNSLTSIKNLAFSTCKNLESVNLSENLTEIGLNAFELCTSLKTLKIPNKVEKIDEGAFLSSGLTEIKIPDSVTFIGGSAFGGCKKLENVKLPKNLKQINAELFLNCSKLNNIEIPTSVENISDWAFYGSNLKKMTIPKSVKSIGSKAFGENNNLSEVKINDGVEFIPPDAFFQSNNLKSIDFPNSIKDFELTDDISNFKFFTKTENGFSLSTEQTEKSLPLESIKINLGFLSQNWDDHQILFNESKNKIVADFYNKFLKNLPNEKIKDIIHSHNFTFLKKMNIDPLIDYTNFYKFLYNTGAVSMPIEVNGKKIDYAQKIGEFVRELERKNIGEPYDIGEVFKNMKCDGFKSEFNEFLLKDFTELLKCEQKTSGFLARCYNEFEVVQKTNTNDHGSQRQLKPTVKKFEEFFNTKKFTGITDENMAIATTIAPYFNSQEIFDYANQINSERIAKKTPNNILSKHLYENPFKSIDEMAEKIKSLQESTANNLTSSSQNIFTFDWLEKNDPQNFILGKLCSCCAHLNGAGYGIMHASIVDPYVQNLVIRNSNGEIVAKSTLYINPNERFGVFNNVEINENISFKQKNYIYKKYIEAVSAFAEEYNKEHPEKPLKQINVGMNLNDLEQQIDNNSSRSKTLFPAINYGKYGRNGHYYSGDSELEQYIVWKANEKTNEQENNNEKN